MFEEFAKTAIALSGGIDSSVLAAVAVRELGPEKVLLLHAQLSGTGIPRETDYAGKIAGSLGCRLVIVPLSPLEIPEVRANGPMRCYFCKKFIFNALLQEARKYGFETLADGTNADDAGDWRPGRLAADELGILHPFESHRWGKAEIREEARKLRLFNAEMPSSACMASRIPTGMPLKEEILRKCRTAEEYLSAQGFPGTRVRALSDEHASVEFRHPLPPAETFQQLRQGIHGFRQVEMSPEGYRTGSMNRNDK